jgi:replicative superfamily II helicase
MTDFNKLRQSKTILSTIEPLEIFRRLPKPAGINDLYNSQAQVLNQWFERRNDEKDLVIKLHTGGGKTLVGLLIAQSILNEHHEPVIYLAPTNQLVDQIFQKAIEYNIPAVKYKKGEPFSDEFLGGKSVLICNYNALFTGHSRFGVSGSGAYTHVAAIILDDAHTAFSTIRDIFTLKVEKKSSSEMYSNLTNIFRDDFNKLGKIGTFDDITSGAEDTTVEVPYWSWKTKCDQIRSLLKNERDKHQYVWPLLRDKFDYCHC